MEKETFQIKIGMDVAASEFLTKDGKYDLNFKKQPNDGAHGLHYNLQLTSKLLVMIYWSQILKE